MISQRQILGELEQRVQANHNGSLVFFKNAGLPLRDEVITLVDLRDLCEYHPDEFAKLIDFLYPEHADKANAGGNFDWQSLVGGILMGAGQGLSAGSANDAALVEAQHQADLQAQQAASTKKTMIIVIGIFAVLVVAAVIVFARRKH